VLGSIFSSLGSIPAYVGGALNNNRCLIDFSEIFGSTQRFTSTVTYPYFTIQNRKAITHSPGFGSRPYSIFFVPLMCRAQSIRRGSRASVYARQLVYVHVICLRVYIRVRPYDLSVGVRPCTSPRPCTPRTALAARCIYSYVICL
jgi:hypothetical protein